MSTVKNVSGAPEDLPDGRLIRPGALAERVDTDDPAVRSKIDAGTLIELADKPVNQPPAAKPAAKKAAALPAAEEVTA